ncbi:unnamed protein product [Spodoptera littoralis]|uniref:Aminopeptidase n=1 Tax=Spodoptera littoralis TaxID=7109 RepID=A0A9P0IJQ4_SPOLI|nr:unnamed protein product [Spodoptera littoralis]CAH1647274.1 unnamed protein product [Spodoptera littoralis]
MASRWFNLILGVILLQSVLAFGPIDVTDAEWIEYMNLLSDPNYRLPTTTKPINYKVKLDTNLQNFEYSGDVEIKIKVGAVAVNEIQLHCRGLTITPSSVSVSLDTTTLPVTNLVQPSQSFTCEANTDFLKISTSNLNPNTDYIVKMSFTGTLQTDMRGFYRSWYVDNSGQRSSIIAGKITETFYTTPIMSTYLLAFIVSNYIPVETGTNSQRPFRIFARNNIGDTGKYSLEIGEKLLSLMETYTAYPYYTMADNMEMKQAAIPDFSAGAMENWGLLTYREALILYDPANSNNWYKQRIANIISHEIAHMWFGNLVTCDWWDTLWLNEGFARFYQYYLTHEAEPEMGYGTRFIVEQLQVAMLSDSFASAHALTNPDVSDPDSVRDHFSTITFAKGASILRMTQHLLGENIYQRGLQAYLKDRAFTTATPEDLFRNLDAAAGNALDAYDGMTIARYFKSWSDKAGHPLLTVNVDHVSGRMTVVQTQFDVNDGVASSNGLWDIPLTWTRAENPDFNNLKPSEFMSGPLKVIDRGSTGREWVIFNKQQSGFYRVNYDPSTWALITLALRSDNREVIHEYNRAQIVDDVFVLARSSIMSYTRALNILSFLEFEDKYAPWAAAIPGFNFALRRLAHDDNERENLKGANSHFMDDLLRMHVMTFLCNAGHEQCSEAATQSFQAWRFNGTRIPPNMRPWVYCGGLRNGNEADFDYFWQRYLAEDLSNEKVVMINAAGCTGNENALHKLLNIIVDTSVTQDIRPQDYSAAISSAVETWLTSATPPPAAAITVARHGIATSRANMQWYTRRLPEFAEYFRTGYIEEGFEVPDSEPSTSPTTIPEPTTTEEPISDPTTPSDYP